MLHRTSLAALLALVSVSIGGQQQPTPATPSLLIRGATVIVGTGEPPRRNADVFVRDGRVAMIGTQLTERAALTLDAGGLILLPGLIDAHVHLAGMPWEERAAQLKRVLQGGVTSVYDVASDLRNTSDLARPGDAPWNREITPETDLVRAVAEARGAGATSIKLYAALDAETVRRIGAEAKRQNVWLIAHSTVFPAKPSDLVAAGVKYLAHAAYLVWEGLPASDDFTQRARGDFANVSPDSPLITRLLQAMKDNDVALNPTLWIFAEGPGGRDDKAEARTKWMNAITKRAQEVGVTIAAGVDRLMMPNDPLPTLHKELEVMVTGAGLTPLQAITAATRGAARGIGVDGERGTIATGKYADLLLVDGDPSADIRNTRNIRYVIKEGRIVHTATVSLR